MSARTLGPWEAVAWSCHAATTIKAGDAVIAECSGLGRHGTECLADARFIAAAPRVFDALRGMCERARIDGLPNDSMPAYHEALAAIADAEEDA